MRLMTLPRHKKSEATKDPEESAFEPMTIRSRLCGVSPNRRMKVEKSIKLCKRPPRSAWFWVRQNKVQCALIHLNTAKFSLFCLSTNLCCHCCWSLSSRNCPGPLKNRISVTNPHSIASPVVRLASRRFTRRHFAARLVLRWDRALPSPFFGRYTTPPCSTKQKKSVQHRHGKRAHWTQGNDSLCNAAQSRMNSSGLISDIPHSKFITNFVKPSELSFSFGS